MELIHTDVDPIQREVAVLCNGLWLVCYSREEWAACESPGKSSRLGSAGLEPRWVLGALVRPGQLLQ